MVNRFEINQIVVCTRGSKSEKVAFLTNRNKNI